MRKIRTLSLLLLFLMILMTVSGAMAASAKNMQVSFSVELYQNRARSLMKSVNQCRKENGLSELVMTKDMEALAIQRAAELFVLYDHSRPDMTDYNTAADEYSSLQGYGYVSELIGAGYSKAEDLWNVWETEAADVILDDDYTHLGVGCVAVKGSENEYYWCAFFLQAPSGASTKDAGTAAKAGQSKTVKVQISSGMFSHADTTHKSFELRVGDLSLKNKTTAEPTIELYDKYGVKIGKADPSQGFTYKSGNTKIFTVDADGTVKRVKNGEATLTVKFTNLSDATCTVTVGGTSSSSGGNSSLSGSEMSKIVPELTAKEYSAHTTLSVYVKGADGYVLYRSTAKNGTYSKVDEQEAGEKWTCKLQHADLEKTCYYKVRAYVLQNGKRVYSEYSAAVKVAP